MRLVIYIDFLGVEKIELTHSGDSEREQAHRLYESLRADIERLDLAAKAAEAVGDAKSHV